MIRFTCRQLAATMVIAASACLTLSFAGEAPAGAPPKVYVMPKKGIPDYIRKAVESPGRPKEHTARDADRKPAEILALAGVRPGSRVVEFASMGLYYSTLLADVVGPNGKVHMSDAHNYLADPVSTEEVLGKSGRAFAAAHPNTSYEVVDYDKIEFPRGIDIVFNVLYFHELLARNVDLNVLHSKMFKAMRPGAIYLIVDHASDIGDEMIESLPLHRLDPSLIRSLVQSAGFQLVVDSRLLENLADDHKWNVLTTPDKRDQTDQSVFMFRKPVN